MQNYLVANNSEETAQNSDDEVLRLALERFKIAEDAYSERNTLALKEMKFLAGDQWPDDIKAQRKNQKRPVLTINRLPQFVRQITNDQRQNRPSIKVFPVDGAADKATARIYQGIVRHIEIDSDAEAAYDTAFEGAVEKGFGHFRIYTEYVNPMSFDQDIKIGLIENAFSVYLDPDTKKPDRSDANWGFIFIDVPKEEFKTQYPDADLSKVNQWQTLGTQTRGWVRETTVRVAEYYYREFKSVDIAALADGTVVERSKVKAGQVIKKERTTVIPKVKWAKLNGQSILEKTNWDGSFIPIISVMGQERNIDGKKIVEGIVRHSMDSQTMYNFFVSSESETIALAPKAPYIIAEGQIKGYEKEWKNANTETQSVLTYVPTSNAGIPIGPPQRNAYEPATQAITNARLQAADDIKATTGIYDSALGARSNETSGVAIRGRQAQAQTSNFHFVDNLTRALRYAGKQIVELIPLIYDTGRTQRIIGEEGEQEVIEINREFEYKGEKKTFELNKGKYDVVVETGPSFATKRLEAAASMMDFMRALPAQAALIADLIAKGMDWPGSSEIAERLRKGLPPGIAEDPNNKQPLPPQVQAQLQQMDQMIAQMTEKLKEQTELIKNKKDELESKERIEYAKIEADMKKELAKIQGAAANLILQEEINRINERMQMVGFGQPIEAVTNFIPQENENQNFNGPGPEQTEAPNNLQQPTGGLTPG